MAKEREMILVKARDMMNDFMALNSSRKETMKVLKEADLNPKLFEVWQYKMKQDTDTLRIHAETLRKLCSISGLSYDDYFIGNTSYRKDPSKPTMTKVNTKSKKLKNGIVVTTYIKEPKKPAVVDSAKKELTLRLSSFRTHMEIYRKLLGLLVSDMEESFGISDYADIENGSKILSISTYFEISKIFIDRFKVLPESPLKTAFSDLATNYNDIYIKIVYFGDTVKRRGRG